MMYEFFGKVVSGKGRGKNLGFPTINLNLPENLSLDYGVYATRVVLKGKSYNAAMHFGVAKTFGENEVSIEVHLLDFFLGEVVSDQSILGESVHVQVYKKNRNVQKFESPEALKNQIALDICAVREYFM